MPVLISPVVVGLIWGWALDRQNGLVNQPCRPSDSASPAGCVEPNLALGVIIVVGMWTHLGFYAMILLSGLQGDRQHGVRGRHDRRCHGVAAVRLITLPLLRPTTLVVVILATIHGFQAFDYIFTLTGGGPVGATTLIVQYIYENAFQLPDPVRAGKRGRRDPVRRRVRR